MRKKICFWSSGLEKKTQPGSRKKFFFLSKITISLFLKIASAYCSSFHVLTFLFILLHRNFNVTQQIFILCIILKHTYHENYLWYQNQPDFIMQNSRVHSPQPLPWVATLPWLLTKMRFRKTFYHAVLQFLLKLWESIKVTFFDSDYELIKQFISKNLVEISSKSYFLGGPS